MQMFNKILEDKPEPSREIFSVVCTRFFDDLRIRCRLSELENVGRYIVGSIR